MSIEYTVIFVIKYIENDFINIILNRKIILKKLVQKPYIKNLSYYCDVWDKTIKHK